MDLLNLSDMFPGTGLVVTGTIFEPLFLANSVYAIFEPGFVNHAYHDLKVRGSSSHTEDLNVRNDGIHFKEFALYSYLIRKKSPIAMSLLKFIIDNLHHHRAHISEVLQKLDERMLPYAKECDTFLELEHISKSMGTITL